MVSKWAQYVMLDLYLNKAVFFFFYCTTQLVGSSSQTRDQTWALAVKVQNPNHWTTREFPKRLFFKKPKGGKSFLCRLL